MNQSGKIITIWGVPVTVLTRKEIGLLCEKWLSSVEGHHIVTANSEILLAATNDPWFHKIIRDADLITADSMGIRWAAAFLEKPENASVNFFLRSLCVTVFTPHRLSGPIPEKCSGSDLLWDLSRIAARQNKSVYLIGGKRGIATKAAEKIRREIPGIRIHAFNPDHLAVPYPYYDLHNDILNKKPDLVFVGYGSSKQEDWIHQNLRRFPSIKIAMGVGGAFDFIAGRFKRAPLCMQHHALEWLWRLLQNPRRLIRSLRAVIVFPLAIFYQSILNRES